MKLEDFIKLFQNCFKKIINEAIHNNATKESNTDLNVYKCNKPVKKYMFITLIFRVVLFSK